MDKILIGKPVAQAVYQNIASLIKDTASPRMAIIKIGDDPASEYYATNILKQCTKHGFDVFLNQLPSLSSEQVVISLIERLNHNNDIHGIIIQKPLPKHLNEDLINVSLNPSKDIDGIHPENLGKLFLALDGFCPCTALSVLEIIKYYNIETTGRHVVILGRSSVIAKPLAGILLHKGVYGNATVTICHSYTKNLKTITNSADILVAAIGVPGFVTADFIKENAICIDVGINQIVVNNEYAYVGDIDYNSCFDKALAITPVPGGVGSVTTSMLLANLTKAFIARTNKKIY